MSLQLVQFTSTDKLKLPGLLYEPEQKTDKVALYLHGNGSASVFYSPPKMNLLGEELNKMNISFFPFNNRGAHYIHKLEQEDKDIKIGTALELIKDCDKDIEGAINFLSERGYRTFYLIGSSTGANKIVTYHYYHPKNRIKKYILLSGGDDTGLYYEMFGKKKFHELLEVCKKEIKKGNGRELIPQYLGGGFISYQSLFDTINPDGDYNIFPYNEYMNNLKLSLQPLFRQFKTINKSTLVVYGEKDEYCYGDAQKCIDILKKECVRLDLFTFRVVKDADHGFHGKEKELTKIICDWL